MLHLTPGDPARVMLGERATPEALARLRADLGLNDPWYIQYWRFLSRAVRGDFGKSIKSHQEIRVEIRDRFPATVELALASMVFATILGMIAGIISATKQYSIFDYSSMVGSLVGISMPIFWLGLVLIIVFSVKLGLFPLSGRISPRISLDRITNFYLIDSLITGNWVAFKDALHHLVLPSVALGTIPMAFISRMTRSSMLEVIRQDFIRTAQAKGLAQAVVTYRHALKNAMIPVVTVIGLEFGYLLGGAILTETIFAWPGIGRWLFLAVGARDFRAIQGGVLLVATVFVLINLAVDMLYAFLDPRIRY
jgi:peptide/nickel transport system permease protein